MAICIVVLTGAEEANQLAQKLATAATPLIRCDLIRPKGIQTSSAQEKTPRNEEGMASELNPVDIETIELLNPNLSKKSRQKRMALWLLPFGFIAGFTFTKLTGLTTFSELGFGYLGESLSGGLVGMASGWMGSYVASASVSSTNTEDIVAIKKLSENGLWLLLLETPLEIELPWNILREDKNLEIFRLLEQ